MVKSTPESSWLFKWSTFEGRLCSTHSLSPVGDVINNKCLQRKNLQIHMSMESQLKLHSISAASQQNTRSEMGTWTWPEVEGVNNIFSNQFKISGLLENVMRLDELFVIFSPCFKGLLDSISTMDTTIQISFCSWSEELIHNGPWSRNKLDFLGIEILKHFLTERANVQFSAWLTWIRGFNHAVLLGFSKCYQTEWFKPGRYKSSHSMVAVMPKIKCTPRFTVASFTM